MPTFSIQHYTEYLDEYEVEAEDLHAAKALADAYTKDTPQVRQVAKHLYVDFIGTVGCRIEEDGSYGAREDL